MKVVNLPELEDEKSEKMRGLVEY